MHRYAYAGSWFPLSRTTNIILIHSSIRFPASGKREPIRSLIIISQIQVAMVSFEFSFSISRGAHPPNNPPPYSTTNRQNSDPYFKIEKLYTPTPTLSQPSTTYHPDILHPLRAPHTSTIKAHRRSLNHPALAPQHQHLEPSREIARLPPTAQDHHIELLKRGKGRCVKMGDSNSNDAVYVERRMSYGRGGAGNIRSSFAPSLSLHLHQRY
jgi:hypothetical protein